MKLFIVLLLIASVLADNCFYNCTYSDIKCDTNSLNGKCIVNCYPKVAYNFIMQSVCKPIKGLVFAGREMYKC